MGDASEPQCTRTYLEGITADLDAETFRAEPADSPPKGQRSRLFRLSAVLLFGAWNGWWLFLLLGWAVNGRLTTNDWSNIEHVTMARPYDDPIFQWSVPAAWIWARLVVPLGFGLWSALHFAALATIRNRGVVAIALLTFPFWYDVANGNVLTFAFVAAWHALQGRRPAAIAFVVLAALVPRPLMIPVLAWLLVRVPSTRWAFAAAAVLVLGSAAAMDQLGPWISRLAGVTGRELGASWNVGPSSFLGAAWIPVGLVIAVIAWWRGHLGLASIAISPYLIHYYAIMALLEFEPGTPTATRLKLRDLDRNNARDLGPDLVVVGLNGRGSA